MRMLEVLPVAMLATAAALVTWYLLFAYTSIELFQSFYSIMIFPVAYGILFILLFQRFRTPGP